MKTPNLFSEATHELSHSAFLSWLFQSARAEGSGLRHDCAQRLFDLVTGPSATNPLSINRVEREYALQGTGRIDLLVEVQVNVTTYLWGIETKLRSGKDTKQLRRYKKGLEQEANSHGVNDTHLSLYSTRHIVRGPPENIYSLIRREDVLGVLESLLQPGNRDNHGEWLLEEYRDWLRAEQRIYDRWSDPKNWSMFVGGSEEITKSSIAEIVHYKFFTHTIAQSNLERLTWGTNSGGQPWTQFKITHPYTKDSVSEAEAQTMGTLFYRMDLRARKGQKYPYLEIRQYTESPTDKWLDEKKTIGSAIKELMTDAVSIVLSDHNSPKDSFVTDPPYASASYRETALCGFHFHDGTQPTLATLTEVFPIIHDKFTALLKQRSTKRDSLGNKLAYFVDRLA